MAAVQIDPVRGDSDLTAFLTFPWRVYQGDPHWVPPLLSERRALLDPKRNPFFQHARVEYFLARRDGQVVGTIAAFTNQLYNQFQGDNTGFFGFFEALDDPQAARALLAAAEAWNRAAGHTSVLGPAQFSTNDECGLLVDGLDDPPRLLMTYNPPRYAGYLEQAGFTKARDLWAYRIDLSAYRTPEDFPAKLRRVVEGVRRQGKFTVRTVDMKRFDEEVEGIKRVYNRSWERNWGFVPMTDAEIGLMAEQLKPVLDPDLIVLVEHEGEVAGFGLSLPDLNQPLRLARARPGDPEIWTTVKLLYHWKVRRRVEWVRVLALGVMPEFRGQGVDALLYYETGVNALRKGFRHAEMSWILEDNTMMNRAIRFFGGKVYKTYRMYHKELPA
jgi:GNAT superfamily N-acetyltransferase